MHLQSPILIIPGPKNQQEHLISSFSSFSNRPEWFNFPTQFDHVPGRPGLADDCSSEWKSSRRRSSLYSAADVVDRFLSVKVTGTVKGPFPSKSHSMNCWQVVTTTAMGSRDLPYSEFCNWLTKSLCCSWLS